MSRILTFTVKPESKFYSDYFAMRAEHDRFYDIAISFLTERGITGAFYQEPFLAIDPDEETLRKYRDQLRKNPDRQGFYHFLKKSDVEKAWESEVAAKISFSVLSALDLWYFDFIESGRCNLWRWNDTIYGYLESRFNRDITPDESWMQPIKVSEYYAAGEAYEEEKSGRRMPDGLPIPSI